MPDVDEKVVRLTLDNKDFDKDTEQTIKSLDELKESLKFEGVGKGFDEITRSAKRVDLNPIEQGVQAVSNQFNLLTTIADATFRNLTNKAIDAGERMIKSLSIDQVTTGWSKYAEQTGAVQTIMAATSNQFDDTATQMEEVNAQLEKLTWFTDETSHKFNDMVGGIGKFTSNNVDLDTSVKAMQGIATWASLSGANTNEASRAIYNLAQAVSTGYVKLIDWNSIATANMGTTEFRQTVLETAVAMGTLKQVSKDTFATIDGKGTVSIANFTDEMKRGWFTSEVLLKSLEKYGGFADELNKFVEAVPKDGFLTATAMNMIDDYVDGTLDMVKAMELTGMTVEELSPWLEKLGSEEYELGRRAFRASQETKTFQEAIDYVKEAVSSGWATSFKYIFGDYLEAKEWWSEISEAMYDVFVVGGEIRNTILEMWKEGGGRNDFLDGIRELIVNVKEVLDIFKESWDEVFYGDDEEKQLQNKANALINITKSFKEFAEAIKPSENTARNLKTLLKSIFSMLRQGMFVIKSFAEALSPLGTALNVIAGVLFHIVTNVFASLTAALNEIFTPERINAIGKAITFVANVISGVLQISMVAIAAIIDKLLESIPKIFERIKENGGGIKGVIETLKEMIMSLWESFSKGTDSANVVVQAILFIFGGLVTGIQTIIETIIGLISGELTFDDVFGANGSIAKAANSFVSYLTGLDIPSILEEIINWTKDLASSLFGANGAISEFLDNLGDGLEYLASVVTRILDVLTIDDIKDLLLIAILWNYVNSLSQINKKASGLVGSISTTFTTINNLLKGLSGQGNIIDKLNTMFTKSMFLQIGIAVTSLVAALGKLNNMDWEKTQISVAALGATLAMFVAAFYALNKLSAASTFGKHIAKNAEKMAPLVEAIGHVILELGVAMFFVVQALDNMNKVLFDAEGKFDVGRMLAALGTLVVIFTAIVVAAKNLSGLDTKGVSFVSIVGLAVGMMLVTNSLIALTKVTEGGEAIAGALAIGGMMVAMGYSIKLMGKVDWKNALATFPLVLATSLAMTGIVVQIALMSLLMDANKMTMALSMFGVVMITFAAVAGSLMLLAHVLEKIPPETIKSIGLTLMEISASIAILAVAIKQVEGIDFATSGDGLIALASGFVLMAGGLTAMSIILKKIKPVTIQTIGFALIEFGAAILEVAFALKMLSGVELKDDTMDTLWGLVIVFSLLGVAIGVLAVFLTGETAKLVGEAINNLGAGFMKFGVGLLAAAAAISILHTTFSAFAAMVIAAQAFADKVGIDLPTIIQRGMDTVELIIREFLEMLRNLAPDFLLTFVSLFGLIATAIFMVKHPTATAVAGVIMEILQVIESHGQDMINSIVSVINLISSASELFNALTELCYTIGVFLAEGIVLAICGALAGIVGGLAKCIEQWLGISFDEAFKNVFGNAIDDYNAYTLELVESINNPNTSAAARNSGATMAQEIVTGFANGEYELEDEVVASALRAIYAYEETVGDEAHTITDQLYYQLAKGIADVGPETNKLFKEFGYSMIESTAKGTDPVTPFDALRELINQYMASQLGAGLNDIQGVVNNMFEYSGEGAGNAWWAGAYEALGNGSIDFSDWGLLFGYRGSKGNYDQTNASQYDDPAEYYRNLHKERQEELNKEANKSGYEVGNNWADGLGSALGSSKAGAKGAKEQAEKIKDAFQEAFDEWDLDKKTDQLLYDIWKLEHPDATDAENLAAEIANNTRMLKYATEEMATYENIYKQNIEKYGADSKEAVEAMHEFYNAYKEVLTLQNKITELQDQTAQSSTENANAFLKFSEAISESYDALKKHGFSDEQIRNAIANETGWKQPLLQTANELAEEGKAAAEASANGVVGTFGSTVLNNTEYMTTYLSEAGKSWTNSIGEGVKQGTETVVAAVNEVEDAALEEFRKNKPSWLEESKDIGRQEAEGNAVGIEENAERPIEAARQMTEDTIDASKQAAEINSPSKQFIYIGEMMVEGLRVGIMSKAQEIASAAAAVVERAIAAARAAAAVHSPSREGIFIGKMIDMGFVVGLNNYADNVEDAAESVISTMLDASSESAKMVRNDINKYMSDAFDIDMNEQTIKVVLDIDSSKATKEMGEFERLTTGLTFGGSLNSGYGTSLPTDTMSREINFINQGLISAYESTGMQLKRIYSLLSSYMISEPTIYDVGYSDQQPTIVNYNQNITSPKAVSRLEVYRDTKKLLSATYMNSTNGPSGPKF